MRGVSFSGETVVGAGGLIRSSRGVSFGPGLMVISKASEWLPLLRLGKPVARQLPTCLIPSGLIGRRRPRQTRLRRS